jgi:hypothetical protein
LVAKFTAADFPAWAAGQPRRLTRRRACPSFRRAAENSRLTRRLFSELFICRVQKNSQVQRAKNKKNPPHTAAFFLLREKCADETHEKKLHKNVKKIEIEKGRQDDKMITVNQAQKKYRKASGVIRIKEIVIAKQKSYCEINARTGNDEKKRNKAN